MYFTQQYQLLVFNILSINTEKSRNFVETFFSTEIMNITESRTGLRYSAITMLVFGNLGNLLIIGVMCTKQMKDSKISLHLISLSVVDTITLWLNIMRIILQSYDYGHSTKALNLLLLFNLIFCDLSSWITVIISLERVLAVYFPFKFMRRSKECYCFIMILSSILLCIFIITALLVYKPIFSSRISFIIFCTFYAYIPAAILLVSSILMSYKLLRRPDLGQQHQENTQSKNSVFLVVSINTIFLLTTFPVSIAVNVEENSNILSEYNFLIADVISCINHTVNCILYFCVSEKFRKTTKKILKINCICHFKTKTLE